MSRSPSPAVASSAAQQDVDQVRSLLREIKDGVKGVRQGVQGWKHSLASTSELTYPTGISLLSLKNQLLLSYLHHLLAFFQLKLTSQSLTSTEGQEVVASLVKLRVVLEKISPLEGKLKYQIEKLVRKADQAAEGADDDDVANDPLAFRPNPSALMMDRHGSENGSDEEDEEEAAAKSGVYRPPRVAAMPYTEGPAKGKKPKRALPSHMISDMSVGLSGSTPYGESTSGLSVTVDPSLSSGTARHLKQVEQYEMDNFTRMRMSKKDAKKRRNEEEEVAFGGLGAGRGGKRRLGGFGAEFDDLLGDMGGERASGAYEQMKGMKAKKARTSTHGVTAEDAGSAGLAGLAGAGGSKKGRKNTFDKAVARAGKARRG
ncbi:hypothetical protein BCR35DRAFT_274744 [Leucosporidium creatinivorum]|uniref:Sas10/Utp3/C1D family-domain-containing protein n=1 Tax=Leucosporidium creatinivorum TaxID=106004 RepID=A0A1Y2G1H4_9BASI|nr:hypothetical protein BCR35DRAFT_274744 [Leucosporidium creatinivorum]